MSQDQRIDLHCHSSCSGDGHLTPEALVARLAAAGVRHAALTDHDTIEGLAAFRREAERRGIGSLPGVEITCAFQEKEIHLLAYGFDPDHDALGETLRAIRETRSQQRASLSDTIIRLRTPGRSEINGSREPPPKKDQYHPLPADSRYHYRAGT